MEQNNLFLIGDIPGLSPQMGRLVSMMNYARHTTLRAVANLTADQLDHFHDEKSNSIGALLYHFAATEVWYGMNTFEGREEFSDSEQELWAAALDLGEAGRKHIHGHPLSFYLDMLQGVREKTLAEFAKRDDHWLNKETPFWQGMPANNYFKWFHVLEDEINHRGQIQWLKKRLNDD